MIIKEGDGKRYIEFNKTLIVVITAIVFLVIAVFYLIFTLNKYGSAINNDPLRFGAKAYNVMECNCISNNNLTFNFNQEKVWRIAENKIVPFTLGDIQWHNVT